MGRRWGIAVAVPLVVLAAGCTDVEAGTAEPAPNLKPQVLTGPGIAQAIVDATALSRIFGRTLTADPEAQQHVGGPEELLSPVGPASPANCLGPTEVLNKGSYDSASVKEVARWTVVLSSGTKKAISLVEGVVALPSVAETTQWQDTVSDVSVANSVLVANVANQTSLINVPAISLTMPGAHAIGVRGNCLVEAKTGYIDQSFAGEAEGRVVDIAHAMMAKVSDLT
jgi:hypothetical protein